MVRSHAPKAVINPRSGWEGDFYCDEGSKEVSGKIITVPWEKNLCLCSGASWGWMAEDPVQEPDWLIRMLVNVICRDGNILWNIAPDKNGKLSPEIRNRIREFGDWIKIRGEAIYSTRGGPIEPVDGVFGTTFKGSTVYLHILDNEKFSGLPIHGFPGRILRVCTFDGAALEYETEGGATRINTAALKDETDNILKITLDQEIRPTVSEVYFSGKE